MEFSRLRRPPRKKQKLDTADPDDRAVALCKGKGRTDVDASADVTSQFSGNSRVLSLNDTIQQEKVGKCFTS